MRIATASALVFAALFLATGCAAPAASIDRWRGSVDQYVAHQGGDPNVLRDVTLYGDRRGFGLIGGDDPRRSRDARALLLAHEQVLARPTFVYLVGLVDRQEVEDIRLALRTQQPGQAPTWRLSREDDKALRLYKVHNEGLWRRSQPQGRRKSDVPPDYTTFPRTDDQFEVTVSGSRVEATHPASGARWHVDVSAPQKK